jgi:hypothetical protein
MAYGEITPNVATSVATFAVRDTTWGGEYPAQLELTSGQFGGGDIPVETAEILLQKIVTAIQAHPDLIIASASRSFQSGQVITP